MTRALALIAIGVLGFISSISSAGRAATPVIRVGVSPVDGAAPLFYAQKMGLFEKHGVGVQFVTLNNSAAVVAAIAGGSLDVGLGSPLPIVRAYARGLPLTIIGSIALYRASQPDSVFVVRADAPFKTPKDLDGKTLGANDLQDMASLVTSNWLDQNGVDRSTIKYVELPESAMLSALEDGRIAGAAVYEPFYSAFMATGKVRVFGYPYSTLGSHFAEGVLYGNANWAAANRDTVVRFLQATEEAAKYVGSHEADVAPLTAQFTGANASALAKAHHVGRGVVLTPSDIQAVIDVAAKYKTIPRAFAASELICSCALTK